LLPRIIVEENEKLITEVTGCQEVKVKVKQSRYRPGVAQRVTGS